MDIFISEWLNLLFRWAHFMVGITWIGTSFYFMQLDYSLRKRERMAPGVYGTAWEVHGGGFYHVEKYAVAPAHLPDELIWHRWAAYLTWVTGFALLAVQYYWNASTFLIDKTVLDLAPWQAIAISLASVAVGWLVYDAACRSPLGERPLALAVVVFALVVGAAYGFTHVFSSRGAFIHVGVLVGTIMAANVFWVIIPNQKIIVGQLLRGEAPDGKLGKMGKARSTHNNYLTLPVLLMMISNHYPLLYAHPRSWLVVAFILVAGGTIRHYINRRDAGDPFQRYAWAAPTAVAALLAAIIITMPARLSSGLVVSDAQAMDIATRHCSACHARKPTHAAFEDPPKEIVFETVDDLRRHGPLVVVQAVHGNAMPLGNETEMTDEERAMLGAWLARAASRPREAPGGQR